MIELRFFKINEMKGIFFNLKKRAEYILNVKNDISTKITNILPLYMGGDSAVGKKAVNFFGNWTVHIFEY